MKVKNFLYDGNLNVVEVVDQAGGQVFLFLPRVSPRVSGPEQRVGLGLPHGEQLGGQLVWPLLLLVCEQLQPVWPPASQLAVVVWLCLAQPAESSQSAISC